MNTTWGRAAVVLSIGALVLSGCGDDDEPSSPPAPSTSVSSSGSSSNSGSVSPTGSASPSVSESASPSAPSATVPAAARARTEAGAIAFLKFFVAEVNRGQTSPGSVDLFAMSDEACIACRKLQDSLQEYVDNGWSVKQAPVQVSDLALANSPADERVILNFTYEQLPVTYYKGGAAQGKLKAVTSKNAAAIRWVQGAWELYDFEEL